MLNVIFLQCFAGSLIIYVLFSCKNMTSFGLNKLYGCRLYLGMAVVFVMLAISSKYNLNTHYDLIGVNKWASRGDVLQAIRLAKKKYHPDKNRDDTKQLFFDVLKAEATMSSETKRNAYNKFGDYKDDGVIDERHSIFVLALSFSLHLFCCTIGFFFSTPKMFQDARGIFTVYNIAAFCLEMHLRISDESNPLSYVPIVGSLLPFEKAILLRRLFPGIMSATFLFSASRYRDIDGILFELFRGSLITNKRIIDLVQSLLVSFQSFKFFNKNNSATKAGSASSNNRKSSFSGNSSDLQNMETGSTSSIEDIADSIKKPIKQLASTMNETQKAQLKNILTTVLDSKKPDQPSNNGGGGFFNTNIIAIIIITIVLQYFKS